MNARMIKLAQEIQSNPELLQSFQMGEMIAADVYDAVRKYFLAHRTNESKTIITGTYKECFKQLEGFVPAPPQIQCKAGCHYCCHIRVSVTVGELITIADHLRRKFPPAKMKRLKRKLLEYDIPEITNDVDYWIKNRVPCAFLDDKGECTIYKARPLQCRGMNSLDAAMCKEGCEERKIISYPYEANRTFFYEGVQNALATKFGRDMFVFDQHVELNNGLRVILENWNSVPEGLNVFGLNHLEKYIIE